MNDIQMLANIAGMIAELIESGKLVYVIRCKDCKYRSFYCTEATDGTTLYECHHPCANGVSHPSNWFCADGKVGEENE